MGEASDTAERRRQKEQTYADTLEVVRDHFRLSNVKLAALVGMPVTTARTKVRGIAPLSAAEMDDFAQALQIPVLVLYMRPEEAKAWLCQNRQDRFLPADSQVVRKARQLLGVAA